MATTENSSDSIVIATAEHSYYPLRVGECRRAAADILRRNGNKSLAWYLESLCNKVVELTNELAKAKTPRTPRLWNRTDNGITFPPEGESVDAITPSGMVVQLVCRGGLWYPPGENAAAKVVPMFWQKREQQQEDGK